jgi:hypothetical protein
VHGSGQIGIGEAIRHNAVDYPAALFHPHNGPDAYGALARGPEVKLVGSGRLELGGYDAAERVFRVHVWIVVATA